MKTLYTLLLISICFIAFAQKSDSTHMHYRITRGIISHQTVLKSKPNIKNGLCEMISGRKVIASGIYKNDERIGRWRFFNHKDSLEQVYNYSSKQIEYNAPNKDFTYYIDSVKTDDRIIYPAKIGGFTYSLNYLLREFRAPLELRTAKGVASLFFIFTLNDTGKLIKFETKVASSVYNRIDVINLDKLRIEDFEFSPAMQNGKPVPSTLVWETKLTIN